MATQELPQPGISWCQHRSDLAGVYGSLSDHASDEFSTPDILFNQGIGSWTDSSICFQRMILSGALSTAQFFLYEAFLGQHFEAVELEGYEPEPGDLFLFRLTSPAGRWLGAHVGVYCGQGEIIHFEGRPPPGPQAFLGPWEGMVSKQGRRQLLRSRSLWRVLRKKGGVDRKALKRRVQEAMDADVLPYHPTHSNCVHFALTLLGQGTALQGLSVQ